MRKELLFEEYRSVKRFRGMPCCTEEIYGRRGEQSDFDALLALIDAEIAELEAMERAGEPLTEEEQGVEIILLTAGPFAHRLMAKISEYTGNGPETAKKILRNLPHSFIFEDREQASQFMDAISDADGIAIYGLGRNTCCD